MHIVILDYMAMGEDTPFDALTELGRVSSYPSSTHAEALSRVQTADVIVTNKVRIDSEIIRAAKNLKLICVFATGYDNIDIEAASSCGVGVCNVPGYSTDSVVLFTVTTVLALASHIREYNDFVRLGEYSSSGSANRLVPVYHEMRGKVWGIVGYGNIGRAVAKVAEALGAKVIVNKRSAVDDADCVDIDTLCATSDIITLHCPLNRETRGLIDKRRLEMMKNDVILVNEARGAVIDECAVAEALREGRLGAFGCDVYSCEPFDERHPYYAIKDMPNVLLTPHAAWGAYEARERCVRIIADNIRSFVDGNTLNRVDK